jgi:hypothetical protein
VRRVKVRERWAVGVVPMQRIMGGRIGVRVESRK